MIDEIKKIQGHFANIDADGSGSIDFDEFTQLLRSLGLSRIDDIARLAFDAIDENGNGEVDFKEFCTWWNHGGKDFQAKT